MCNEYQKRVGRDAIEEAFRHVKVPIRWADPEPNRPLDQPIRPTERATVLRPQDPLLPLAGLEGLEMRWWLVPHYHRGPLSSYRAMTTNARIETVDQSPAFRDAYRRRRCLVPLTSFIEYSEPNGWKKGKPKQRNEIDWPGGGIRFFAGIWDQSSPAEHPEGLSSFAFITGPAPEDVAPVHDRSPAVLTLEQGLEWLDLEGPGKSGIAPAAKGTLRIRISPRTPGPDRGSLV